MQGVLAARIDRLAPEEKALLQQLAVIGREFSVSLLRQVITQPEDELYRLLASLQRKEFLYEQPAFPEVEYIFKHALTQEVAYGTVLQERRKSLHEKTAQAIEALYRATSKTTTATWRIITVAVAMPQRPWSISVWRDSKRHGSRQTRTPSPTSLRLLICSRPCRTPPPEPAKNSPFTSVSALR